MASQKILVIDDSRVIRRMVKDMLPAGNVEVLEAKDGVEGLAKIRSESPTLIMLDFLLPKKSGWEVYQEIQKDTRLQIIPLMLMSGRKEEVTEKLPEPFEYFAFVEKPFEKDQLVSALKEAMQKSAKKKKAMKDAPAPVQDAPVAAAGGAADAQTQQQMQQLAKKVIKLEKEVATLKSQLGQLVKFIKQKLK